MRLAIFAWLLPRALGLLAQDAPQPQDEKEKQKLLDEEAKDKTAAFKKVLNKAKVEDEIIFALREMCKLKHPRILKELKNQLGHPSERVRRYVLVEITNYRPDPEALKILLGGLGGEAAKASQDDQARDIGHEPACEVLRGLRGFNLDDETIKRLVSLFRHQNLMLASQAVRTCGEVRAWSSVDPMISLLREVETMQAERPNVGDASSNSDPNKFVRHQGSSGGAGSGPKLTPEQAKQLSAANRKQMMTVTGKQTLEMLLGQKCNTAQEFAEFWAKNKTRLLEEDKKRREEEEGQ